MLVTNLSRPSVYSSFKRQNSSSSETTSVGSIYGDALRANKSRPSTAQSFYSLSSASSPSLKSGSSPSPSYPQPPKKMRSPAPLPLKSSTWDAAQPLSALDPAYVESELRVPAIQVVSPASILPSAPDTPLEVPESELRRRQLHKLTRILGEAIPADLITLRAEPTSVLRPTPPPPQKNKKLQQQQQYTTGLGSALSDILPPRRSMDAVQPQRRAGASSASSAAASATTKLARRASLSFNTIASRLRSGSHSRDSSLESGEGNRAGTPSPTLSAFATMPPRRRSLALGSPILFAFPRRSQTPQPQPRSEPVPSAVPVADSHIIDIGYRDSEDEEGREREEEENGAELKGDAIPIVDAPLQPGPRAFETRIMAMPAHTDHSASYSRPGTPFDASRPQTPFEDFFLGRSRPATPFMTGRPSLERPPPRPDTPFLDFDPQAAAATTEHDTARFLSPTVRKERAQGWSGEWNKADIKDVMEKLRKLK